MHYDVFNGDADGIISLLQLRLDKPLDACLITGVKRDIQLLQTIRTHDSDSLTVLDISMQQNHAALIGILESGASVFYADHHQSGDIPSHQNLDAHVDLDANMCTALIIDRLLGGKFTAWAITAAYGDNLIAIADQMCSDIGFNNTQAEQLKELGTLINYNGYGQSVEQLHFHPAELYRKLLHYPSPFDVFGDVSSPYYALKHAYDLDFKAAIGLPVLRESRALRMFALPDADFPHRISGVYGNWLANESPSQAHIVLTVTAADTYAVSLRAPLNNKQGAGELCSLFKTGGGREAAGGINRLPQNELDRLFNVVDEYYG